MSDTQPMPLTSDERRELDRLRAEVAELRGQVPAEPVTPRNRHRFRSVAAGLVIVLGCVLAPLSVASVWLDAQLTDTDAYVETVAPLIEQPAVQEALATAVTTEVFRRLDVRATTTEALQAIADRTNLPPLLEERLVGLAVPLTNGVEGFVSDQVNTLVASGEFQAAWVEANRVAHQELVATLTGEREGAVQVDEGTVSVNIAPFVEVVKQRLIDRGLTVAERIPDVQASFVVMQSADLVRAQSLFAALDTLGAVFPFVVIAILGAGVMLALDRRRALVGAGLGVAGSMVLLAVLLALLRAGYLSSVPAGVLPRPAATIIFDTLVSFLRIALRGVLLLGLIVALAAFLGGPSKGAVATRRVIGRGLAAVRGLGGGSEGLAGAQVARAVRVARRPLQVVIVTAAGLTLVFWDRPTPAVLIGVVLVVLLLLAVIEVLGSGEGATGARSSVGGTSGEGASGDAATGGVATGGVATGGGGGLPKAGSVLVPAAPSTEPEPGSSSEDAPPTVQAPRQPRAARASGRGARPVGS